MSISATDKYEKHMRLYRDYLAESQRLAIRFGFRHPDVLAAKAKAQRNYNAAMRVKNPIRRVHVHMPSLERPTKEEIQFAELMSRI